MIFSISDSVSTESSVSEPELRLDNDPSERAPWVWMTSACHSFGYESLEAPVALGVRIQFVAEVFR